MGKQYEEQFTDGENRMEEAAKMIYEHDWEAEEKAVLTEAISHYGSTNQMIVAIEEMSELQKEICKYFRGVDNVDQIAEEVADVEIMLEQLKMMLGLDPHVLRFRRLKIGRLAKSMRGGWRND